MYWSFWYRCTVDVFPLRDHFPINILNVDSIETFIQHADWQHLMQTSTIKSQSKRASIFLRIELLAVDAIRRICHERRGVSSGVVGALQRRVFPQWNHEL